MNHSVRGKVVLAVLVACVPALLTSLVILNRRAAPQPVVGAAEFESKASSSTDGEPTAFVPFSAPVEEPTIEPVTPAPRRVRNSVTLQEKIETTRLATRLQKEYFASSAAVGQELTNAGPFFRQALASKVAASEELVRAIALAQGLRDPELRPCISSILRRDNGPFFAQGWFFQSLVTNAKLNPDLLRRPITTNQFESLLNQSEDILQKHYSKLLGQLQLDQSLQRETQAMHSSEALLRLIVVDMADRGYDRDEERLEFAPRQKKQAH